MQPQQPSASLLLPTKRQQPLYLHPLSSSPDIQRGASRHPARPLQVAQVVLGVGQRRHHQEGGLEGASVAKIGREQRRTDAALQRLWGTKWGGVGGGGD